MLIACGLFALVILGALGGVSLLAGRAEPEGVVFVIPNGAAATVDQLIIDSVIAIPTDIRLARGDMARIMIRNEDPAANRAGPWVINAGQSYRLVFDKPGTYQFNCTVDPKEPVTVE